MLLTEDTVYELLSHLADSALLEEHPVAKTLTSGGSRRGQALRALLIDALERLKPPPGTPAGDPAWRPYSALRLRYVDLRTPLRVQDALGLSERQVRREQRRGIIALASLLGDTLTAAEGGAAEPQASDALRQATEALRVTPARLDAFLLLSEMERIWEPRLSARGVGLELPEGQQCVVYADRVTLRQILLRLLGSLSELSRGGAVRIGSLPTGGDVDLCFSLPGTGQGPDLPADVLSECGYLAELNLGRVWQERVEQELRVHCVLPGREPLLFLVVDDERVAVRLVTRCLQGYGVRVVAAEDAGSAVETAAELGPDVIALDVLMPGHDGWEVLQQLKSSPETRDIPVIVCSVWREPELALALGASEFIRKPVTRPLLLQALSRALPTESAARFLPVSP